MIAIVFFKIISYRVEYVWGFIIGTYVFFVFIPNGFHVYKDFYRFTKGVNE